MSASDGKPYVIWDNTRASGSNYSPEGARPDGASNETVPKPILRQTIYETVLESEKLMREQFSAAWPKVDLIFTAGPHLPPAPPHGGGGGGAGDMPDLESKIAKIEERLAHTPTNWTMVGTVATVSLACAGLIITVFWNIVADFKLEVRSGFLSVNQRFDRVESKLESFDGRLRNVESDTKVINSRLDELQKGVNTIEAATTGKH